MSTSQVDVEPLWRLEDPSKTNTTALRAFINARHALTPLLSTYEELYAFSVTRRSDFWKAVWDFCGVVSGSISHSNNHKSRGNVRTGAGDESEEGGGGVGGETATVVGNYGEAGVEGACVDEAFTPADNPAWFPGVEVCWAENMLRHAKSPSHKDRTALIQVGAPLVSSRVHSPF